MKNFHVLLQTLIDNEAKPNSILCFCRDLYEYKQAEFSYKEAPTRAVQRKCYKEVAKHHANVRDWLVTLRLDSAYKPEDFIDE